MPDEQAPTYGPTDLRRRAVAVIDSNGSPAYSLFYDFLFSSYSISFVSTYSISSSISQGVGGGPGAMFVARRAATEGKGGRVGPPLG